MSDPSSIPVGGATLLELLRRARARATATGHPVLATYVEPLPGVDPLDAFDRCDGVSDRVYWARPSAGVAVVGVGAAVTVAPSGQGRFAAAARMWRALLKDGLLGGPGAVAAEEAGEMEGEEGFGRWPMLLGGFRFDTARPADPLWLGYPDAWMVVPSLCLSVSSAGRWLTSSALVRPGEEVGARADALDRERDRLIGAGGANDPSAAWAAIAEALRRPGAGARAAEREGAERERELAARGEFERGVALASESVREGRLDKVVIARAVEWQRPRLAGLVPTLRRLGERYPDCHIFAVARGRRAFLGASPERLVEVSGDRVRATSLAGSIGRKPTSEEDRRAGQSLLASAKNREEHAIVVRSLTSALSAVCEDVRAPAEPALLTLPDVHHLYTPVTARLKPGVGVLDVVASLHPTPAVGGAPRGDAMEFIRVHERWDRGWYAAPVGWMDARGNGEFAVALRSALLDADKATLFAGCGIVGDSDPTDEYEESELKLRAMRGALDDGADDERAAVACERGDGNGQVDPSSTVE